MPRAAIAAVLSAEQIRAHRILSSGLDRSAASADRLPVWDLGLQDRDGSSRLALAARLETPVIASGGVGSLADLQALREAAAGAAAGAVASATAGIEGVIVGRALYDGSVGVAAALAVLSGTSPAAAGH